MQPYNPGPPQQQHQPQMVSNEIEDFQAGGALYPGGTGIVEECCYKLWDYNGTRPKDSDTAAYIRFRPIDGSNEGKVVEQYWSVGSSADFLPDNTGGNLISTRTKPGMTNSTNWAHFLETLRNGCGLERGRLSSPMGIRVMQNAVMTLVRVEQKHREGLDELPKTPGLDKKKAFPKTTLVPTRATFSWDPNYANATKNIPPPPQPGQHPQAQAMAQTQAPAPQQQYQQPAAPMYQPPAMQPQYAQAPPNGAPAPMMANAPQMAQAPVQAPGMAPGGDFSLGGVIRSLLAKNNGALSVAQLPNMVLTELGANVTRDVRVAVSKESKDMNALAAVAQANGWTLAGDDLIG